MSYDDVDTGTWNDLTGKRGWSILNGKWGWADLTGEIGRAKLTGEYQWKEMTGEGWLPKASRDNNDRKEFDSFNGIFADDDNNEW